MSEDDWFERAIRDRQKRESSDDGDTEPDGADGGSDATESDSHEATRSDSTATGGLDPGATTTSSDAESSADSTTNGTGLAADSAPAGDTGQPGDAGSAGRAGGANDGSGSLFDGDFSAAMEDVELPDLDGDDDGTDFSMGSSLGDDVDDFGMGGGDIDFGGGFDAGGGFGGGGFGGGGFDDDEFESDLPRIDLGITGLDQMILGGVPERSLMVAIGSAGTGKTTFGMQFLNHGMRNGERGIYITLEESHERVIDSATEKGMPFDEYLEEDLLAVVDLDPVEMANSLASIRSELPRLIEQFGASRLVLDSVSLLEMMYDERATRRNEIFDFTQSLKESGITTMMTSEASEDSPYASRHGIVEYLTDAVFILQYVRPSDFRETRLAIEIQKIRDANHSRETKPYEITDTGISVHRQANIF
ncbi:KaiC domain-containing protein [Haloarchaeobius sp. TZWWS8]|uniref:KaiC domain-containing protein n=1 Tax=Haloarchaeobius sp. TZWWS8 TaxID=3446121 RepID=UPI003EBE0155